MLTREIHRMIRFNRQKNKFYDDHSELLRDPAIHAIIAKPRSVRFRSQQPTMPAAPTPAPEDPSVKFDRMVKQLMDKGLSYTEAVKLIDSIDPTLRQRSNELATARRDVAVNQRRTKMAQWRAERALRFNARKAGR